MKKLLEYADEGDTIVAWRIDWLGLCLIDLLMSVNMRPRRPRLITF